MWSEPPPSLSLSDEEVHVWRVRVEQEPDVHDAYLLTLDQDERVRASRFHFDEHRRHFVVARGFLRRLLARYLDTTPEDVSFAYGTNGKPMLGPEQGAGSIRFNASHSGEWAVYAFARDREVGVDVECVKDDIATEGIAERFFSAGEVETLNGLPKEEQAAAFFRCWTRKEAYIKAIGDGLSHPLDTFDVTLRPGEPAALLNVAGWSMFDLDVASGYAAAIVVEGSGHKLQRFESGSV
jgi:4'-phosphopantetheinyl transferase